MRLLLVLAATLMAFAPARAEEASAGWPGPATAVRLAPERDYGPFIYVRADGQVDGLSMQMLDLVARAAGIRYELLPARPLAEQLRAAQRREADLVTSLRPTPERGAYLVFTRPYVAVPAVLATRDDRPAQTLGTLTARPVAVGKGYAVEAVVRQRFPGVDWQAVPDDVQALRGVVEGRFDGAVLDTASLAFIAREHGLRGVRAVAAVDFDYELSFAVRSDWPGLRDALDRAIVALPVAQRDAVLRRWLGDASTSLPGPRAPWATRVGIALLVGAAALAAVFAWRRRHAARPGPTP